MANSDWSHTKTFYKRICTTFGDNAIHRLRQREGLHRRGDHYTANIQRDSWEILNGTAEDKESMESFISRCSTKWEKVDLSSLDEEISKAEVESAIAACKGGACGPDNLGNEWYKDHRSALVPVLTMLFNACMAEGHTPVSFLEHWERRRRLQPTELQIHAAAQHVLQDIYTHPGVESTNLRRPPGQP
jgi:hypothetical protein